MLIPPPPLQIHHLLVPAAAPGDMATPRINAHRRHSLQHRPTPRPNRHRRVQDQPRCRRDASDKSLQTDCSAHSVIIDLATAAVRPLTILTDTWCSSGQFTSNGTLLHTGGDFDGNRKIPCPEPGACDWVESSDESLKAGRWYGTNQLLPDGRTIVIGGRDSFTLEFVPSSPGDELVACPFLSATRDMQMDNLYPYVHLLPDGNLFIFANRDSIVYDYNMNAVVRKFPTIPGGPRNYPSGGSSVLLPLRTGSQSRKFSSAADRNSERF